MNDLSERVTTTKNALMLALGENASKYLANMKLWFRHKWSKEEFDFESRKFLTPDKMHLHNQFLIAILNKIDAVQEPPTPTSPLAAHSGHNVASSNSGGANNGSRKNKRKRSSRSSIDRVTFDPYDFVDFAMEDNMKCISAAQGADTNLQILPTQRYCAQELFLPDAGFMLGRFLVGAWEADLLNVDDGIAEYMATAVQLLLKNLISAIIAKHKHYKVTGEGTFYYDMGAQLKDPFTCNTVTRQKIDNSPLDLDKEITSPNFMRRSNEDTIFLSACEEIYPITTNVITLKECRRAFKDRNLIASHSIYAINMERLTQMMH